MLRIEESGNFYFKLIEHERIVRAYTLFGTNPLHVNLA